MADRSPPDRLNIASFKQRNSAITEDLERQEVERENLSATAADPEGGRRAAAHVGDGAREVAATRSCVTNVC